MKKLLIAFLTFAVGVFAFYSLKNESQIWTQKTETTVVAPKFKTEIITYQNIPDKEIGELKPFFDSFGENEEYRNFGGWFIADDFKGMPEVWTILLDRGDEESTDGKTVWSAMVLTQNADGEPNDDDIFQSVSIATEGNRLSFKTNKIRGIEYKFDGRFARNGVDFSQNEKVLKGTMQKIVKGKQVAKFTAGFAYHEPRCFH